ncbi:MAG: hypothetical protein WAX07_04560 [Candidatus Altiarchaeia archaeon]
MAPLPPPLGPELLFEVFPPYFVYTLAITLSIALIFYWLIRNQVKKDTPMDVLRKRYAKGEVDAGSFRDMKKEISK